MNRRVPHGWLTAALFSSFVGAFAQPGAAQATPGLKVQYRAADTSATDNQIKPHLNVVNTGTASVPLSELTVRVLVREGHDAAAGLRLRLRREGVREHHDSLRDAGTGHRDGGHLSGARLHRREPAPWRRAATGEIQNRLTTRTGSPTTRRTIIRSNPTKTAFADWTRVTLYRTAFWSGAPSRCLR